MIYKGKIAGVYRSKSFVKGGWIKIIGENVWYLVSNTGRNGCWAGHIGIMAKVP